MKNYLEKIIAAKTAVAENLRSQIKASADANEVRALGATLEAVLAELQDAQAQLAEVEAEGTDEAASADAAADDTEATADEGRAARRSFNPIATYSTTTMEGRNAMDDNMQYRLAFAKFVTRGTPIPAEMRADATTTTTNAAVAIPENLINTIIEQLDAVGMILPLLTKTSYAVGQTIPVDSTKPTASWVSEGASSDAQAKGTLGSIVFAGYKLRCEISMTQEVSVQTISAFETLFIKQVSEAMTKAIESKIVSADDGSDCPTGILYRSSGSDPTIEIAKLATGHFDYKALCDAEAALPQQYEGGAKWFMSKKTFMSIYSQVDSNGQPIGRINYGINGKPERILLGRDVVLTGSYLADYTEAAAEANVTVAFLFDPSDYVLNTSYDLGIKTKEDWDTEDVRIKAVMSVDGKVIDRNSIVKVVKKYN